jgi:hypothetical protein
MAGSRLVEASAAFVTPILVIGVLFFARRFWLGLLGAGLVILVVYLVRTPYLDYVHHTPIRLWGS